MDKSAFSLYFVLQSNLAVAAMQDGRWHAGLGDPTLFGWLTVLVYLLAVVCCLAKVRGLKTLGEDYLFWLILAVFLLFLGINKQLDLQSWLTQEMRDVAKGHGWYEQRGKLQFAFVVAMASVMLVVLFALRLFLVKAWYRYKLAWIGIILLCAFVLIRAASFHHVDLFIHHTVLGLRMNVVLENGALTLIILGSFYDQKAPATPIKVLNRFQNFLEVSAEGDDVHCPQCHALAVSKAADGRQFKCKACATIYNVRVRAIS